MSNPIIQDWEPVVFKKKTTKQKEENKEKQKQYEASAHLRKLESDDYEAKKPSLEMRKFLILARNKRGLSQKELANKLQVQPNVIGLWESGKEVISGNSITGLNRILKVNMKKQEIL